MATEIPTTGQKHNFPGGYFETDRWTRIYNTALAIVLSLVMYMIIILFGIFSAMFAIDAGLSVPVVIAVDLIICILCIHFVWKTILYHLRFCLIFHPRHLQVGRRLAKCIFPYGDVEKILLFISKNDGTWIEIFCKGTRTRVILDVPQLIPCVQTLRYHCVDSIFIDEKGKEHLPQNPKNTVKTITTLKLHYKKKILIYILLTLLFSFLTAAWTINLINWWKGNLKLNFDEILFALKYIFSVVCIPVFIWKAWESWKTYSYICDKQANADTAGENPSKTQDNS